MMRLTITIAYTVFIVGASLTVAAYSYLPSVGSIRTLLLPRSALDQSQAQNRDTWPDIPFSVQIDTTAKPTRWLHFSYGGRNLTSCRKSILEALLSNVMTKCGSSSPGFENQPSTFRAQDVHFSSNPENPTLTTAVYLDALVTVLHFIDKWGAKELDFEIGLDAGGTTCGDFHIGFGGNVGGLSTSTIDLSRVISSSIPISCQASARTLSASRLTSGSLYTALGNQSLAVTQNITAIRHKKQTNLSSTKTNSSAQLITAESNPHHSRTHTAPSWRYPTKASWTRLSDSSWLPGMQPCDASRCHSTTVPHNRTFTGSYITGHDSRASKVPSGGNVPHESNNRSEKSVTLEGFPINNSQAFGGSHSSSLSATVKPFFRSSLSVTSVEALRSKLSNGSLNMMSSAFTPTVTSLPQVQNASKGLVTDFAAASRPIRSSSTGSAQLFGAATSVSSATNGANSSSDGSSHVPVLGIILPVPVAADPVPILPPAQPGLPGDGGGGPDDPLATSVTTPSHRGKTSVTAPSSSITTGTSSCSACFVCPTVLYAPNLGLTSGSDADPVETSSNETSMMKALAGRFYVEERDFEEMFVYYLGRGTDGPFCPVKPYVVRRNYPSPTDVSDWEGQPNMPNAMAKFSETATWWAIPTELPNCGGPDVSFEITNNIEVPVVPDVEPYVLGGSGKGNRKRVTMDHVFEVKFLDEFFMSQITDAFNCEDVATLFDPNDYAEWPEYPNVPDSIDTRLHTIFGQLARYAFPDFVGMDDVLNRLKSNLWNKPQMNQDSGRLEMRLPIVFSNRGQDNLEALASITVVMKLLNIPYIKQLFHNTNDRVYKAFAGIDEILNEAASPCNGLPPYLDHNRQTMKATWASAYKTWMTNKISLQNMYVPNTAGIYSSQVPTVISPNVPVEDHWRVPGWSTWMSNWNQNYGLHALTFPSISTWPAGSLNIQKRRGMVTTGPCNSITSSAPPGATVSTTGSAAQLRGFATVVSTPTKTSMGSVTTEPNLDTHNRLSLPPRYSKPPTVATAPIEPNETPIDSTTVGPITNIHTLLSLPPRHSKLSAFPKTPTGNVKSTTSTATSKTSSDFPSTILPSNDSVINDLCGSMYQDKPLYPNICNAKVNLVSSPAVYGVYCTTQSPNHFPVSKTIRYSNCNASYADICAKMTSATSPKATWVWSEQEPGCALGFYLPARRSFVPSPKKCETLIFTAMVDGCATSLPPSNFGSVNVLEPPSTSGIGTGVDDIFARYIISPVPLQGAVSTWDWGGLDR